MAKSLEEINREFELARSLNLNNQQQHNKKQMKGSKTATLISNIVFYASIAFLLVSALAFSLNSNADRSITGYRCYQVLTGSMQEVYPQGSLVFVKETDKKRLQAGDDVTYYVDGSTRVTHRIIEVIENYEGNYRGFRTQGVQNTDPDPDIVHEENIVGQVVFCIPMAGQVMRVIVEHIWIIIALFIGLILFSFALRIFLTEGKAAKAT